MSAPGFNRGAYKRAQPRTKASGGGARLLVRAAGGQRLRRPKAAPRG